MLFRHLILLLLLLGNVRTQILLQILQSLELAMSTALFHPVGLIHILHFQSVHQGMVIINTLSRLEVGGLGLVVVALEPNLASWNSSERLLLLSVR